MVKDSISVPLKRTVAVILVMKIVGQCFDNSHSLIYLLVLILEFLRSDVISCQDVSCKFVWELLATKLVSCTHWLCWSIRRGNDPFLCRRLMEVRRWYLQILLPRYWSFFKCLLPTDLTLVSDTWNCVQKNCLSAIVGQQIDLKETVGYYNVHRYGPPKRIWCLPGREMICFRKIIGISRTPFKTHKLRWYGNVTWWNGFFKTILQGTVQ